MPKNRGNRCPAFRSVCAGKRRNAQIYARYALKSLSHGITDGVRQHEAGVRHGTAAVQEDMNRRIRRFPETVLHKDSGIPDRQSVAQRRGKTSSYSRHDGQPFLRLHESLKPETESDSLTFDPAELSGRKLRKPLLTRDGHPQLLLPVLGAVQFDPFRQRLAEPFGQLIRRGSVQHTRQSVQGNLGGIQSILCNGFIFFSPLLSICLFGTPLQDGLFQLQRIPDAVSGILAGIPHPIENPVQCLSKSGILAFHRLRHGFPAGNNGVHRPRTHREQDGVQNGKGRVRIPGLLCSKEFLNQMPEVFPASRIPC